MIVLLAGAAPALIACEHGIDLEGKVSVPAEVQRMFSTEHPGELVIKAQIPGQLEITAPSVILCDATGGDRVIDVKVVKPTCASEETVLVSAWVVPRAATDVRCGVRAPLSPSPSQSDELSQVNALAAGRSVVSVNVANMATSGCRDGTITFALTLAPR